MPINKRFLVDINTGVGRANLIGTNPSEYYLGSSNEEFFYGIFIKGQLRYYLNRERRAVKNRSLRNNTGSFMLAIQTQF